ncbi:DEAD/DEAH box helicase [Vibrio maritimus]|uniref:DEAD/DEAH box helicase n=1 Tax=Vibrio maritimus TaxID=990268 RepID=UPI001F448E16|nr:DEAD/DEAH box helicase [Vibrio maritimus]
MNIESRLKLDLTNMLYESLGLTLITDKASLSLLIQRLKKEQAAEIVASLSYDGLDYRELNSALCYELLQSVAQEAPRDLYHALGIGQLFDDFDKMSEKVNGTVQVKASYPSYDYQIDCALRVRQIIDSSDSKRALLHLPTGAGKTRTAMNIVCDYLRDNPNSLVVWLADTKELCEQASDEFQKAWGLLGNHNLPVYSYYGDSELSISGLNRGFLVAGLQKLHSLGKKNRGALSYLYSELRKSTALIIFDEAHIAIAPTYKHIVEEFLSHSENNAFLLGLSATPGRTLGDNDKIHSENKLLSNFFENNKVTMRVEGYDSPLTYLVENGYLSKAEFVGLDYDDVDISSTVTLASVGVDNGELLRALSSNRNRNEKLIETISHELDLGSQIIVFACTVSHANELTMMLTGQGVACRSIDGTTPKVIRAAAIKDYRERNVNVLINFGVLTAGFDAPCTNVTIIARPTNSLVQYSQMAGRAMRGERSGGNRKCRVYTVNDNIPEFRSVYKAFEYWDQMWKPE